MKLVCAARSVPKQPYEAYLICDQVAGGLAMPVGAGPKLLGSAATGGARPTARAEMFKRAPMWYTKAGVGLAGR